MHKTFPLLLSLLLVFTGCASTSSPKGKPQFAPTNLQQATIYVFDDVPGLVGPGEVVVANGVPVGPLSRRQYTWFYVRPGILDLRIEDRLHPGYTLAEGRFAVRSGRSYYIRYRMIRSAREGDRVVEGLSKDIIPSTLPGPAGNLVEVSESDGIAMTTTHRLVDTYPQRTTVQTSSTVTTRTFK